MNESGYTIPRVVSAREWLNWPLLCLVALVPLQNIYLGKIPSLGGGFNILNILMIFALVAASSRRETSFSNPMNKYVLFLAFSYVLSLIVATSFGWDERAPLILKDMFFAYLFFFVTYKSLTGMKAMKALLWATVVPLPYMFRVFKSNLSLMGTSNYADKLRFNNGTFMELGSNELAAFYATYTFVLFGFALAEGNRKLKWVLLACVCMNLYSLLYSFSRGAYLSVIVGMIVFCYCSKKLRLLSVCGVFLFCVYVLGADIFPKAVTDRFNSAFVEKDDLEESAKTRLVLWSIAVDQFKSSPITGIGFGNFKKVNPYNLDTHNYYLKLLAEGGILSFIAFVPIVYISGKKAFLLLRTTKGEFETRLASGFLGCLTALVIGNYFGDRFTHYPLIAYFYIYMAMVIRSCEWSQGDTCGAYTRTSSYCHSRLPRSRKGYL